MATGPVRSDDWSTYRADNARSGSTAERLDVPLRGAWVYASPAPPRRAWSGPEGRVIEGKQLRDRIRFDEVIDVAVVDGRVYFGSSVDHQVHCLDARTGRELWSYFTGGPIRLAPTVVDGRVYVGSDDGYAYCLDAATGELVWKFRAGGPGNWLLARGEMISRWPVRTGVTVSDGIAYFGSGIFPHEDVYLFALRADDGSLVWKRDNISEAQAGRDDLSPQGYLLVSEDLLFVPSGRSLPAAFNRHNGRRFHKPTPSWRREGVVGGTKAVLADGQLYAGGAHHFVAMDQRTGDVGFGYVDGRQMVVDEESAYTADGKSIVRLDRRKYAIASRRRWKLKAEIYKLDRDIRQEDFTTPAELEEARAKLEAARRSVEAIKDRGVLWMTPSGMESALLAAGELLFAGGENRVAAFDTAGGEEVWSAEVEGDARGLAAADGRLYVSTTAGKIYSFADSRTDAPASEVARAAAVHAFPADELTDLYAVAAREILERTGLKRGYCLIVGAEKGRLAYELARRSELKIYAVEPDGEKVKAARRALSAAGLYGFRVAVRQADFADIPYSNYFANLIVSDSYLLTGKVPGKAALIARHLKPLGGAICLGRPAAFGLSFEADEIDAARPERAGTEPAARTVRDWLASSGLGDEATIDADGSWATLTRGKLPGAAGWSHLYADPGNTAGSDDRRVKDGLGVLWYGDPGPGKMVNRHDGAVGPLATGGRLFVQGVDSVMAYDAYNGLFLWERGNPEAQRTGVFLNYNPGNMAAGDDRLFMVVKDECLELDAATGELVAVHTLPDLPDRELYAWGYLAYSDGLLFGTATIRKEIAERLRRRGRTTVETTDAIFAINAATGEHRWTYVGGSISHHTIAIGADRVFFIDSSITPEQRAALLAQDKQELKQLEGKQQREAERRMKQLDVRLAVALDAHTGELLWSKPVDVTDCSEIGTGGGQLTMMYKNNVLVLCGANANGHYWDQFLEGEFSRRRLVALSAADGQRLWAKDANYRHRPIIVEDRIIAEPWGFDLYTGAQQMREHPLTGQPVPWSIIRPGHHCGMMTGCPNMLMFRSGYTGFFDLEEDAGTRHFAGHRLGCWINAIPANGLVMIPEASAGCVCLFSIAATITLEPREARRPWAIFSSVGSNTPVAHMALNLGAPGDRRDARGTPWLAYPRPEPGKETGLDLKLDLKESFLSGGRFISRSESSATVKNAETPWLYTSAACGLSSLSLPLLGEGDAPATFNVKLYFAELDDTPHADNQSAPIAGTRIFDVKLQGQTVLENLDIAAETDGRVSLAKPVPPTALVREFPNIQVTNNLLVELVPKTDNPAAEQATLLNAIAVERTELSDPE